MQDPEYRKELKRKAIHYAALLIPIAYAALRSRALILGMIGGLILISLIGEISRHLSPRINDILLKFFGNIHRSDEAKKPAAFIYTFSGAFLTVAFFDMATANLALTYFVLGDGSAALVGKKWGRIRIGNNKSLEGFLANLVTCLLAGWVFHRLGWIQGFSHGTIAAGAIVAAVVESVRVPYANDNLTVPVAAAAVMQLMRHGAP